MTASSDEREDEHDGSPRRKRGEPPCGTYAAYQRHKTRGEPVDEACRVARNAYMRGYKKSRKPALRDRERLVSMAWNAAQRRLAKRHPGEFRQIYEEELKRLALRVAHGENPLPDGAP